MIFVVEQKGEHMKAIDVLKHLLAKAESETPEGHRLIELSVPVDIVREIISAEPELPRWAQKVEKYHDKALKMPYIKKHRAWALYQAYKEYNGYGR